MSQGLGTAFSQAKPHKPHFLVSRGMQIAPGSSFFQDFGTALVILFLYTLTACFFFFLNSSWKWKYSATRIQKASLWMEAAFATETSVSHGNNTTKLFKMLCWCFCSPQPLGAGRSWAECFGYVTVIASRLGESMGDSFSIACLSDTRKYNSLASVFMTAGFVLPWTSQLPH